MQNIEAEKTATLTEMREPNKVLSSSNGKPVAILNHGNVVGYLVPVEALEHSFAGMDDYQKIKGKLTAKTGGVCKYLREVD